MNNFLRTSIFVKQNKPEESDSFTYLNNYITNTFNLLARIKNLLVQYKTSSQTMKYTFCYEIHNRFKLI
jgi:hypothetical protein